MRTDDERVTRAVGDVLRSAAEPLTQEAHDRIKRRVMGAVAVEPRGMPRRLVVRRLAATLAALTLLASGAAYATERALPGDALYGVRRAAERALLAVLPSGRIEQRLLVGLAARRAEEAARLAREGADPALVEDTLGDLGTAVRRAAESPGSLAPEDQKRIREHAAIAPEPTRSRIEETVRQHSGPDSGTLPNGGSSDDGDGGATPDTTGGAGPAEGGSGGPGEGPGGGSSAPTSSTQDAGAGGPHGR